MAILDFRNVAEFQERQRCDRRQARLLFGIAYPFCLAFAIADRVTKRSRPVAGQQSRQSVFREAKATASSCIPYAFR